MKAENEWQLRELCAAIIRRGYPTGSKVFGVDTLASDKDYVMTIEKSYRMFKDIGIAPFKEPTEEYACCFISLKYLYDETWINLIVVPRDEDLNAWIYATEEMQKIEKSKIIIKKDRTNIFGWLLTEFYAFIQKGKHYKIALEMWGTGSIPQRSQAELNKIQE